jgi:hypothetical protein
VQCRYNASSYSETKQINSHYRLVL